jgi:hypothetical protein
MWIVARGHESKRRFGWEVLRKVDREKVELALVILFWRWNW